MKSLRYIPALNKVTGSINATLLMGQLEYWFEKTGGKAFYKFTEACEASQYQLGDSWCEELGFSKAEFRSAFAKIGKVYKSKKAYLESPDKFEGKYYLSYYDRIKHLTYYVRNEEKIKAIDTQVKTIDLGEGRGADQLHVGSSGISEDVQNLSPEARELDLRETLSHTCTNAYTESPISIDYIQTLQSEIKEPCACETVLARPIQQSTKQSRFHKIASHNWGFAELEQLEQAYIEKKLKNMKVGTNPLLSRLRLV